MKDSSLVFHCSANYEKKKSLLKLVVFSIHINCTLHDFLLFAQVFQNALPSYLTSRLHWKIPNNLPSSAIVQTCFNICNSQTENIDTKFAKKKKNKFLLHCRTQELYCSRNSRRLYFQGCKRGTPIFSSLKLSAESKSFFKIGR